MYIWHQKCMIYKYLCNQCQSPLMLWVWIPYRQGVLDTTLCDKVCQWLATGLWFSAGTPVSSTNKTDCHNITEILLKVALNTINQTKLLIKCQWNALMVESKSSNGVLNYKKMNIWHQKYMTYNVLSYIYTLYIFFLHEFA